MSIFSATSARLLNQQLCFSMKHFSELSEQERHWRFRSKRDARI
jgi:hypothetical protein